MGLASSEPEWLAWQCYWASLPKVHKDHPDNVKIGSSSDDHLEWEQSFETSTGSQCGAHLEHAWQALFNRWWCLHLLDLYDVLPCQVTHAS